MKLLLSSDWHMATYGEPVCRIKRSNLELLRLLDQWERDYELIVLNGDIFEVLKWSRVKFDHTARCEAIVESRRQFVERILQPPYLWTVGNHDYPLESVLGLPSEVQRPLDHGLVLRAEHGHLIRADREFYSEYALVYHLMYCTSWWSSRARGALGRDRVTDGAFESLVHWYWRRGDPAHATGVGAGAVASSSESLESLAERLIGGFLRTFSVPADNNLPEFMAQAAEHKYTAANSLIAMGHSHYYQHLTFDAGREYLNSGRGYHRDGICGVEFDTGTRRATRVRF